MKYIEEYLAEKVCIKPLGTLRLIDEDIEPCTPIGKRVVINDIETDIVIWYVDYAKWLETKYERASKLLDAWLTADNGVVSMTK